MNPETNTNELLYVIIGCMTGAFIYPLFLLLFHSLTIQVEDETSVLVIVFGKLVRTITQPGLHIFPKRLFPWVSLVTVSLQRDFRQYQNIHINDCRGTTVIIDFWIEFRIVDPEKALFHVEDWEQSLQSLLTHSATSILCAQEFNKILCNRNEFGIILQNDIKAETIRWGLEVEMVMIQKVSLLPEVSRQMFATVAAKLERAKANYVEEGILRAAQLEAEISAKLAALVAEAQGQYPAAIGKAYSQLGKKPQVLQAYQELYELSLVRPHRTVSFHGFLANEVREMDAAMIAPPFIENTAGTDSPMVSALSSIQDHPLRK